MSARATFWTPAAPRRPKPSVSLLLPMPVARMLAFTGLATFGALHWARLVDSTPNDALLGSLAAGLAGAIGLLLVGRRSPSARVRTAAMLLVGAALLVVALVAAGVPSRFFLHTHLWDDLASGIGQGLSAVPSVRVPYAGLDEWTRTVIVLGGGVLIGLAALLAFAPRRGGAVGYPVASAVALATLYTVAIVQRRPDRPFLAGAAFALLLALFLWLERIERRGAPLAAVAVVAALLVALATAPRIDAARALLDYEEIAQSLSRSGTTQYDWNHRYGPLNWPRDGREVLRVRSPARSYWKAVNLVGFDGLRWIQSAERDQSSLPLGDPAWSYTIRVNVRALRSTQFVGAGTTLRISDTSRTYERAAPGRFQTSAQPLRRGNTYRARVYAPRPTAVQMRTAGTAYPAELNADNGAIGVARDERTGGARVVDVPLWGQPDPVFARANRDEAFHNSPYARTYALANRLRAASSSPYEYMRAIERFLRRGFAYTEQPPPSAVPLDAFLFRDRAGYCQQFSGAMALLLRIGGVPARVAAGFSPGVFDAERREYVVRDVDAHSWVEVYFPQVGWVTRDPTPAVSPARSQTADLAPTGADAPVTIGGAPAQAPGSPLDRAQAEGTGAGAGAQGSSGWAPVWIGLAAVVFVLALMSVVFLRRGRLRRSGTSEDDVAELRRALRRSGRAAQPHLTLEVVAGRFAGTVAESYARDLAAMRYGYGTRRPSRAQRAGLRRELAAGLGVRGWLRAWWALPPRVGPGPGGIRLSRRRGGA